jgi:hypothetical protein
MALPPWSEVRESLTAAIRAALPLQVRKAEGERIAGLGLHIDAYYGSAGLYLLPEAAARSLSPAAADNIGDWPISTDWDLSEDHARAFAACWGRWDDWFHDHLDNLTDDENDEKFRGLLQVACEAMRQIEADGDLTELPKTEDFKIVIAEHDEPDDLALDRYNLFVRTGTIRVHGDPV